MMVMNPSVPMAALRPMHQKEIKARTPLPPPPDELW